MLVKEKTLPLPRQHSHILKYHKLWDDLSIRLPMWASSAYSDKLRFIFIELPCFNKTEDECETDFERWIYVLKNMEILERMPFKAYKAAFEKLEKITDIAALSKEDRMKYDESIKVYRDINATLAFSKEEGRKEERFIIGRNLKQMGCSPDMIMQVTGLSIEELKEL